jgi:hypothetical protein
MSFRIERYKEAFNNINGFDPIIKKRGSWIYINDNTTAFRLHQLPVLTRRLKEIKNVKDQIEEQERQKLKLWGSKKNIPLWKKIDDDVIEMFLQKMFEHCGNSIVKLEKLMKDVSLSGFVITEYCEFKEDCYNSIHVISELKDEISELKDAIDKLVIDNNELKMENKSLKENSVLFSMDL